MKTDGKHKIEVFEDTDALAAGTAGFIIKTAHEAVAARGRFTISLSGGSTPEKLFSLLASDDYKNRIPWAKTFVFWGDERYVPADDEQNNSHQAKKLLLDKVDIPAANIFITPVQIEPAENAAAAYEKTLREFFGNGEPKFDFILLGIGENGHTASLFPHTQLLYERTRWVAAAYIDEVKMFRITCTVPVINLGRVVVFLVAGAGKASVVKTVITGPYKPDTYPAQLINPVSGTLYWYLDKKAAALLPDA